MWYKNEGKYASLNNSNNYVYVFFLSNSIPTSRFRQMDKLFTPISHLSGIFADFAGDNSTVDSFTCAGAGQFCTKIYG